ncbi:MAG: hypothetical protein K6C94_07110 [Candidatus Gastranaerophilales bacterium]|nr:hypothetical protein [Candidatus Gastranaerophilales bacterium]
MGLFNFFGKTDDDKNNKNNNNNSSSKKPVSTNKPKQKDEMKERLMATLTKNLSDHNFTQKEIQEVFMIIEFAEADIERLKEDLLHIKSTNTNPTAAVIKIKREVELIQQKMAADIKTKIRQIKIRKSQVKKKAL